MESDANANAGGPHGGFQPAYAANQIVSNMTSHNRNINNTKLDTITSNCGTGGALVCY